MEQQMAVWQFVLWGLAGGVLVECVDFITAVRSLGTTPWAPSRPSSPANAFGPPSTPRPTTTQYLVCVAVRAFLGAVLATAMGLSGQLDTPVVTLMVGAAAPVMITRFAAAAAASSSDTSAVATAGRPTPTQREPGMERGL
jgi:hypothetical protein